MNGIGWPFCLKVAVRWSSSFCSVMFLALSKDPLPMEKLAGVVYQIPCQCGKVYAGETQRRLETRIKEHKDACSKGHAEKSAIAEHTWDQQHTIDWEDTKQSEGAGQGHETCPASGKGSLMHSEDPC